MRKYTIGKIDGISEEWATVKSEKNEWEYELIGW